MTILRDLLGAAARDYRNPEDRLGDMVCLGTRRDST